MDITKGLGDDQSYSARGVVAQFERIGDVQVGLLITPVFKYITLDTGKGNRPVCVQFVGPAPRVINELTGEEYLDMQALNAGDFIISPGLLYEKIEWSDGLYAEHLKGLRTYRPKDLLVHDAPDANDEGFDLGEIDLTTDSETKSLIKDQAKKKTIH